jgi:tRNA (cmo5U34)-methyltransferase
MGKFTFATSEEGFDNHIETSIRGYQNLWRDVLSLSEYFVEDNTNVVDIGCSTGKLIKQMSKQNTFCNCNYVGIEIEQNFYNDLIDEDNVSFFKGDVRDFNFNNCSLVTSIFTLQFIPVKDRVEIIKSIHAGLNKGGAFVFSEKVFSDNPRIQEMMTFLYYDFKKKTFTADQILEKEQELRHLLKPNTETELIDMCKQVGFSVQSFWRNYNFVGYVAIKE